LTTRTRVIISKRHELSLPLCFLFKQ